LNSKSAVLLIAHGSREKGANQEVRDLGSRLEQGLGGVRVIPCFLEIESPSIAEAFRLAAEEGRVSILAFPFFLSTGAHVKNDIPRLLMECRKEFPRVEVTLTPALGPDPSLDRVILERINQGGAVLE